MPEGVPGVPSAAPGVAGVPGAATGNVAGFQGAGGGPSPASEGKVPAQPQSSPPSGFGEVEKGRIPYDRFREVNQKLQEAERRNAELEKQLQSVRSVEANGNAAASGHLDPYIQQAQQALVQAVEAGDSLAQANAIAQLTRLSSQAAMAGTMEKYIESQRQASEKAQFEQIRRESLHQMQTQFPELSDSDSEFTKAVHAEWARDPWLQISPTGERDAATRVALARALSGQQQPTPAVGVEHANLLRRFQQLGHGGVAYTEPTPNQERRADFHKAIEGLDNANDSGLHEYIMKHIAPKR